MKITFQLLHKYTEHPLKIIGNALHLTLQDDLLIEIDLRTALDFLIINLHSRLNTGNWLTKFEMDLDPTQYDLTKYEDFIEGFKNRLKAIQGYERLLKYGDELRVEEYIKFYREIADLEMKIREVFSYIFYNKYDSNGNDLFEEFDARTVGSEEPKPDDLEKRLENKFFYLNFSGYLKFERPKEVVAKELIPLIQLKESYEELRTLLNSRGILIEHHLDFLQAVKNTLDPIEGVRNCIAHNRQIPNRTEANYEKAKEELLKHVDEFWNREFTTAEQPFEKTFVDEAPYERVDNLLSVSDWNDHNNEVVVHDHWSAGTPAHSFNNINDLKAFLVEQSNQTFNANLPADETEQQSYHLFYNGEELVNKVIRKYTKELVLMNWL